MCNRYRLSASRQRLAERYGAKFDPEHETMPPGEVFPRRPAFVITGHRNLETMTWGFPTTVRNAKGQLVERPVTNVRNYESPFWRSALRDPARRCLVPFSDFCEWAGEKGSMVPHWFSMPSTDIASFAGIWRPGTDGGFFAFLTCGYDGDPTTHAVGRVHPKACPVVLLPEDEERWLTAPINEALDLACPVPSQLLLVVS